MHAHAACTSLIVAFYALIYLIVNGIPEDK